MKAMRGPKGIITKDQLKRLDDFQRELTNPDHIRAVDSHIGEAKTYAEQNAEGETPAKKENSRSKLYVQKMDELTIRAGLRVKWVGGPNEAEARIIEFDKQVAKARREADLYRNLLRGSRNIEAHV